MLWESTENSIFRNFNLWYRYLYACLQAPTTGYNIWYMSAEGLICMQNNSSEQFTHQNENKEVGYKFTT